MTVAEHHAWFYELCKAWLRSSEFAPEIDWAYALASEDVTESGFLREAAWVVLCSGFRESVVREKFGFISFAFFDWHDAKTIVFDSRSCVSIARQAFRNEPKLWAIVGIAERISTEGFRSFKRRLRRWPIDTVTELPYVGAITAQHLLKNLGFPTAKADRHLARLATMLGYPDTQKLCESLAASSGDPVAVVDSVLWRYCEQHSRAPRAGAL